MDQQDFFQIAQIAAAGVTAFATLVLCWVTAVLAKETKAMAERTSEPHVVVTLEPNRWAVHFFDMHIMNAGNAAAYAIDISFEPALPENKRESWTPLSKVSVLRPGQEIVSSIGRFENLKEQKFEVTVRWHRGPNGPTETNKYQLAGDDYAFYSQLGGDPAVKIARTLEKIEKNLGR